MNSKVSKLNISKFRGIPNSLTLDFSDKNGKPVSAIIYGENGSGKSSIIDSIEFVLQSRIGRTQRLRSSQRPSNISLASKVFNNSEISAILADGDKLSREIIIERDDDGYINSIYAYPGESHIHFQNVPIVLRRNDIISYGAVKEAERQVLLASFLYKVKQNYKLSTDPERLALEEERLLLKNKRNEIVEELQKSPFINISAIENLRKDRLRIIKYLNNRVVSKKYINKYKHKNNLIQIPDEEYQHLKSALIAYVDICEKLEQKTVELKGKKNKDHNLFTKVGSVLDDVEELLYNSFQKITNIDYIDSINLSVADISAASLDIKINLSNGVSTSPNKIFSEANYDLLILLLYISIIRVGIKNGQEKVLILDDVLQSVDSSIRAKFIRFILSELKDWQLFITCHDRLWLNQLRYMFNQNGHPFKEFHITGWSFYTGPTISEQKYETIDNSIQDALNTKNIRIIAATAGLTLEKICQKLSISLPTSVKRKLDDKYTIGDLWPNIRKTLKGSSIEEYLTKVDNLLLIRNLLGCHYNEWADSMVDSEVYDFASTVQNLYSATFCSNCHNWISLSQNKGMVSECKCGNLSIKKS